MKCSDKRRSSLIALFLEAFIKRFKVEFWVKMAVIVFGCQYFFHFFLLNAAAWHLKDWNWIITIVYIRKENPLINHSSAMRNNIILINNKIHKFYHLKSEFVNFDTILCIGRNYSLI